MLGYKITNTVNGKVYIGKHTGRYVSSRWAKHLYAARHGSPLYLHRAIRKYGPSAFRVEVLHQAKTTKELSEMEKSYIALYQSNDPKKGYNMTLGGDGSYGFTVSSSAREKLRQHNLGKHHSKETREKISHIVKDALTEKRMNGIPRYSEEGKKSFGNHMRGSNNLWFGTSGPMGGKFHSEKSRKQTSAALYGIPKTLEHKQALSEARRQWWINKKQIDPSFAEKQSRLMVQCKRTKAGC